jgi:hypothetical protein
MPYIKQEKRDILDPLLIELENKIKVKGELTYCLYKLCSLCLKSKVTNYESLSSIMSCLEDSKLEWYRKKVAPYEDEKIFENGDIK